MADLTVTITESVTLNGAARGSSNALTVSGINDVYHRVITCPDDSQVAVATFKSTLNNTTEQVLDMELVKYIRITNLDASNPIILNLMIDTNEDDSAADKRVLFMVLQLTVLMLTTTLQQSTQLFPL
jgi:hypothetical protein